ncbi:hypothetical protein [Streptomyces sp. PA5.6]|uniref:hypothetical protein n=1 Tax=Streptomyces sp. PA5.6 TaxID=3035651 RepID=UPI0039046C03
MAGREQWTWPYAESTGPSEDPTFVGAAQGRLFFNSGSDLTVLDASDGNVIATYKDVGEVQVVPEHKLLLGRESAGPPPTARSCGP